MTTPNLRIAEFSEVPQFEGPELERLITWLDLQAKQATTLAGELRKMRGVYPDVVSREKRYAAACTIISNRLKATQADAVLAE